MASQFSLVQGAAMLTALPLQQETPGSEAHQKSNNELGSQKHKSGKKKRRKASTIADV